MSNFAPREQDGGTMAAADELADALVLLFTRLRRQRRPGGFDAAMRARVGRMMAMAEELYRRAESDEDDRG